MNIVVFTGPSLPAEEARGCLDATYRAPVAQGDLYRAARERPFAIGIVDGFFELLPAVWHKEILWALSEGIHVFGSASMGALRAAELHVFGMQGVGRIFEGYRDGVLEDDDEVAIQHAPAELRYRPLSEAMVNIRATLMAAERAAVIDANTHAVLLGVAKGLHFTDRRYETLIERGLAMGLPRRQLRPLQDWLPEGRIDQKRIDALAMLHALEALREARPGPRRVEFVFQSTRYWKALVRSANDSRDASASPVLSLLDRLCGAPER